MNTHQPSSSRPQSPIHADARGHGAQVLIGVLLVVAVFLLIGFTALVNDITQRGELRRVQQRNSGSLLVADDFQSDGVDVVRWLSMTSDKLSLR